MAGLCCAFAVIKDRQLRERWAYCSRGLVPGVNVMGYASALAAYKDGQEWFGQLIEYLDGNRRFLADYVRKGLPGVGLSVIEGTYLGWLDCRDARLPGTLSFLP